MKQGASKGGEQRQEELARFQAISGQRSPSYIKMLDCKTNQISVRGRLGGGGEEKGRRREGGGVPVGPNSQTKRDFLLCPNCISTGSFFFLPKRITRTNMPKIATKQPDGLPDKKENYPSAMRNSTSQRPDDNNVPSVANVQIPSCKR